MDSLINKVKDTVGANNNNNQYTENQSTNYQSTNTHATTSNTTSSIPSNNTSSFPSNNNTAYTEHTARTGPVHHNETLNKLDPRVQDQTQGVHKQTLGRDPTDAAHVPPSVLNQHVDGVHVQHDYPHDSTAKRHSVSHQEAHILQ